jgi:hypothetical protein
MTTLVPAGEPFWRGLTVPKSDAAPDENEDAFAAAPGRGVYAVADGATHSGFAGQWARLLVDGFTAAADPGGDWIAAQRRAWAAAFDHVEVPWYMTERREQGAYAAFLGVSLAADGDGDGGIWVAVAIGDACVFHLRDSRVRAAWPIERSALFGNMPQLLGSRESGDDPPAELTDGEWRTGDYLLLMTDALACWFLTQTESARNPWDWMQRMIESARAERHFRKAVEKLRTVNQLKDDDTTLLAIRCGRPRRSE